MADANELWSWLDAQSTSRDKPLRLHAVFNGDTEGKTPVTLTLRESGPMAELSPETRALFDTIDPHAVTSRFVDPDAAARWRKAFTQAHESFPWSAVEKIGVHNATVAATVQALLPHGTPPVVIEPGWYY